MKNRIRIRITITPEIYVDVEPHVYILGKIMTSKATGVKREEFLTYHSKLEHLAESFHRLFLCENARNVNLREAFDVMIAGIAKLNDALQRRESDFRAPGVQSIEEGDENAVAVSCTPLERQITGRASLPETDDEDGK